MRLPLLLQLLAPFAPHLAEELWERLGTAIHREPPMVGRKELLVSEEITIVFQVNLLRGQAQFAKDADKDSILATAKAVPRCRPSSKGRKSLGNRARQTGESCRQRLKKLP